jgi:DUF1365 family protein
MKSSLFSTTILHERYHEFKHKFRYFIVSLLIDHDEIMFLSANVKFFSYNKFNIFSFYEKDHGYRDGRNLREYVEDNLKSNKIIFENLKIKITCLPRIFGYAFNPLSIIYCYNQNQLIAIFYEVKNTSNEQHTYLFASNISEETNIYRHKCNKNFYVSPFIGMKALYKFKNTLSDNKMSIIIDLFDENNKKILTASQFGKKIKFNSFTLFRQLIINPLVTIKVIFAILYESIFIVLKGGKYYARKKKALDTISFEGKL